MPSKKRPATSAAGKKTTRARRAAPAAEAAARVADVAGVLERLAVAIPAPECELAHESPWQLLIATILSAQSTDRTVNSVTPDLCRRWPTPQALAAAPREEVERAVHRTGFFRNKSKAIQACSLEIAERHGGEVPRTMEALVELPGVARKTANVVLGTAFGIASGVVVDTHVIRVSNRLGFTRSEKPEVIEQDLCRLLPRSEWTDGGHRLLLHGRYVCLAKTPDCEQCPLNELCPSREREPSGTWQQRAEREAALMPG